MATTLSSPSSSSSLSATSTPRNRLLTIHQLPAWMRDNDYLIGGYRPPTSSLLTCLRTAFFTLNNDTINVWTHFLGFVTFLCLSFHLLGPATSTTRRLNHLQTLCPSTTTTLSFQPINLVQSLRLNGLRHLCLAAGNARQAAENAKMAVSTLLAEHRRGMLPLLSACVICLAFSTAFHACWVRSPRVFSLLARLDFVGISLLCCGHGASGVYHAFYCRPAIAKLYYALIATMEAIILPAIFTPWFSTPTARLWRTLIFCGLGSVSVFPLIHAAALHRATSWELAVAVGSSVAALSVYAVGATIYVSRFPECCRIGKHDRFFASHQLMHVAVLIAAGLHLAGCWTLLEWRLSVGCSASPLFTS